MPKVTPLDVFYRSCKHAKTEASSTYAYIERQAEKSNKTTTKMAVTRKLFGVETSFMAHWNRHAELYKKDFLTSDDL